MAVWGLDAGMRHCSVAGSEILDCLLNIEGPGDAIMAVLQIV